MNRIPLLLSSALLLTILAGCSGGDAGNEAGPAANSGKTFSKADADSAQPVRGAKGEGN